MKNSLSRRAETVERFLSLNLHDCRLVAVQFEEASSGVGSVVMQLRMLTGDQANAWTPARLRFVNCAAVSADLDFWGKFVCDDAIGDATAEIASAKHIEALESGARRDEVQPFERLAVFTIELCPPGGRLTVIAEEFALEEVGSP